MFRRQHFQSPDGLFVYIDDEEMLPPSSAPWGDGNTPDEAYLRLPVWSFSDAPLWLTDPAIKTVVAVCEGPGHMIRFDRETLARWLPKNKHMFTLHRQGDLVYAILPAWLLPAGLVDLVFDASPEDRLALWEYGQNDTAQMNRTNPAAIDIRPFLEKDGAAA